MNIVDKIKGLCFQKGISVSKLEKDLEFGNGAISKWNTTSPPIKRVMAVAEYFGVSTGYLTGEENIKKEPVTEGDELIEILDACRERSDLRMLFKLSKNATPDDVRKAIAIIEALKND